LSPGSGPISLKRLSAADVALMRGSTLKKREIFLNGSTAGTHLRNLHAGRDLILYVPAGIRRVRRAELGRVAEVDQRAEQLTFRGIYCRINSRST